MKFKDLSVTKKIYLSFGSIVLIFVVAAAANYFSLQTMRSQHVLAVNVTEPAKLSFSNLTTSLLTKGTSYSFYVRGEIEKGNDLWNEANVLFQENIDSLRSLAEKSPDATYLVPANTLLELEEIDKQLNAGKATTVSHWASGGSQAVLDSSEYQSVNLKIREGMLILRDLSQSIAALEGRSEEKFRQVLFSSNVQLALAASIVLFVGIVLAYFLTRIITSPVLNLTAAAKRIGTGDLAVEAEVICRDEIGELTTTFNKMARDLQKVIQQEKTTAAASAEQSGISDKFSENIIQSLSDMLFVLDDNGYITTANKSALQWLEYSKDELIGMHVDEIVSGERYRNLQDEIEDDTEFAGLSIEKLVRDDAVVSQEKSYRTKRGTTIPVAFSGVVMRDTDGKIEGIVCVGHNLTELRSAQAQLVQSAKLASVGEMATGVAHELNQPLGVIAMNAELRLREARRGIYDKTESSYNLIRKQVTRATAIINHLRTFGREANTLARTAHSVNQIIDESFILINEQFRLNNIAVVKELSSDMRPVYCNSIKIEQVLTNLLINARDALENSQEKTVTLRSFESDNRIVVEVEDSGEGIPVADLPKVFDPFFTSKEVGKGTGLGLSISYGIIEDHGGSLSVMNQHEGGARFRMELPLREGSLR